MQQLSGLKPAMIMDALRGAEAALFHVTACIPKFMQPVKLCPSELTMCESLLRRVLDLQLGIPCAGGGG